MSTEVKTVIDAVDDVNKVKKAIESGGAVDAVSELIKTKTFSTAISAIFPEGADAAQFIANAFATEGFRDISVHSTFTYKLAPCFGTLTNDAVKLMDENLKVAIAGTVKELEKAVANNNLVSWEDILHIFSNNTLLVPYDKDEYRTDSYQKDSNDVFRVDGGPRPEVVQEVTQLVNKVIADDDIIQGTSIDAGKIHELACVVAETGSRVDSFEAFFATQDKIEKTLLDVGVLRFPELGTPHFKVYRLQIFAYRYCKRILMAESNKSGISITLNVRKYRPNDEVIAGMKKQSIAKAVALADSLFD
eukprot:CAMPEP_0196762162 /NCGR_PEP_ID=MMETSP1095-20130614/1524_1 /TAXON_ID=96789 ORGANISM="Chromulina nebulosa, Strain UTEXLB2642" /NCGR_SAMPLE_ID=MMETSP1095 /ASSEMBLY_ACC=CAM_ASM_000446 /LENGTH=303 /DNA_ID=CAMNT_0042112563 /DNA_START=32 /DNA_END=943 /DNA_ORIENTATION=+